MSRGQFNVHQKDKDNDSLRQALGIPEARCEELCGLIEKIHRAHNGKISISGLMEEASEHCENANELAFISFVLGTHVRRSSDPISLLVSMLQQSTKDKMHSFSHN
jgi:hypothetical protein